MKNLSDIGVIKEILYRHGFSLTKSLGQNFLIDPDICPAMAHESGAQKGVGVLEIGPGIGVLTAELAKLAEKVVTVELDERLLPILGETLADFENVEVVHGDILKLDLPRLIAEKFAPTNIGDYRLVLGIEALRRRNPSRPALRHGQRRLLILRNQAAARKKEQRDARTKDFFTHIKHLRAHDFLARLCAKLGRPRALSGARKGVGSAQRRAE